MSAPTEGPRAIVDLKAGEVRRIFVVEQAQEVLELVESAILAGTPLVTLTRWKVMSTEPFITRADNVLSVEVDS